MISTSPPSKPPRIFPILAWVNVIFLISYICFSYKYQFHADSAVANTLAQEIKDSGRFFPPGWHYANGDVWVVFLHAFALPLLAFMPNGYALHAVVSLLGAALVLSAVWQLASLTGMGRRARWLALALVASGMSPNMAENLFGQQAYGILFWIGALILVATWQFLQRRGRSRYAALALAVLLIFLAAWGNPQRALVYMAAPMLFGAAVVHALMRSSRAAGERLPALRHIVLMGVLALAVSVLGARLHGAILANNGALEQVVVPTWLSFDHMVRNALAIVRGLLSLLGGLPPEGQSVIKGSGLVAAARFGAAITLLCLLPWALWRGLHSQRAGQLYFAAATSGSLLVSLVIYLMTTVPNANDPEASIRYLVPGLVGAVLLLVQAVVDGNGAPFKRRMAWLAMLALALSAPVAYGLTEIGLHKAERQQAADTLLGPLRFLQAQNAQYGYASYWNAGNTTVLGNHRIKVRQIVIVEGLPRPHRILAADRWYEPDSWQGPTFLFLTAAEDALVDWTTMARLTGQPRTRLAYNNMVYIAYDHNIARDLPLWSASVSSAMQFLATPFTAHGIGSYDASVGEWRSAPGAAGALRFGPYMPLAPGRYQVSFELSSAGAGAPDFGHADVVADGGAVTLAHAAITRAGPQSLVLSFTITKRYANVEYRLFSNGTGALAWTKVVVQAQALPPASAGVAHAR